MTRIATIQGLQVDLDKVQNPKLRRVVEGRGFMFSYSDQTEEQTRHTYKEHTDGREHIEKYGDYSERATHTDCITQKERSHTESNPHKDYSAHSDDYQNYSYSETPHEDSGAGGG
jgi:hypothetical protein